MTAEKRVPITIARDNNRSLGGWFPYPMQDNRPRGITLDGSEMLPWCSYCGEWTIYKRTREDMSTYKCTGWCNWGSTNDFYVRHANRLFGKEK